MTSNIHWMIAAAGADAQQTRQAGFSCVHFCSRLSEEGTFSLTALPAGSRGDYLGIADSRGIPKHCAAFAREAVCAAQNRHCTGILADFERPLLQELTACLNREAQQQKPHSVRSAPAGRLRAACASHRGHRHFRRQLGGVFFQFALALWRASARRTAHLHLYGFPAPLRVSQWNSADRQAISSTADGYRFCGLFLARIMRQILYLYQRRSGAFRFI